MTTADTVTSEDVAERAEERVTLRDVVQMMQHLMEDVKDLKERPAVKEVVRDVLADGGELPRAKSTKEILSNMKKGDTRSGQDRIDPTRGRVAFKSEDIIELMDEDKVTAFREGFNLEAGPIHGVVQGFMYRRRRDGQPKYRVDFGRGIGEDGIMEDEMRLADLR